MPLRRNLLRLLGVGAVAALSLVASSLRLASSLPRLSPGPTAVPELRKGSDGCPATAPPRTNYTAAFLSPARADWGAFYSGMWWQPVDAIMEANYSKAQNAEWVTFASFRRARRVVQTVDWLDLGVEHLSKYAKHFERGWGGSEGNAFGLAVRRRVEEIFLRYIDRVLGDSCRHVGAHDSSAIPSTLAILPLYVATESAGTDKSRLIMLQLSSTIASLWSAGFPRIVVVGRGESERLVTKQALELLTDHLKMHPVEWEYIPIGDGEKNVPNVAMVHFQGAIQEYRNMAATGEGNHSNNVTVWLGPDPSRWQFIYFSEPDLILHIRPEAVPSLSNELQNGHLLNAHRLQPLPHMEQFTDIYERVSNRSSPMFNLTNTREMERRLVPNLASFAAIHRLDAGDRCCDQGNFYPGNVDSPGSPVAVRQSGCGQQWAFCGFSHSNDGNYSDWSYILGKHKLLAMYPFISLEKGTGLPLVHHGQRVCRPTRGLGKCAAK